MSETPEAVQRLNARAQAWALSEGWGAPATVQEPLQDALDALVDDETLGQWLVERLRDSPVRGQFIWRTALAQFATLGLEGGAGLLLAIPCELGASTWDTRPVSQELAAWVAMELGLETVEVNPSPVALSDLLDVPPGAHRRALHQLLVTGSGGWVPPGEPDTFCPALWPIACLLSDSAASLQLQRQLTKPARPSLSFSAIKSRASALAEEQGAQLELGPLSTWPNAFSVAVYLQARHWARRHASSGESWAVSYRWPYARLSRGSAQHQLRLSLETPEDAQAMLTAVGRTKSLTFTMT